MTINGIGIGIGLLISAFASYVPVIWKISLILLCTIIFLCSAFKLSKRYPNYVKIFIIIAMSGFILIAANNIGKLY